MSKIATEKRAKIKSDFYVCKETFSELSIAYLTLLHKNMLILDSIGEIKGDLKATLSELRDTISMLKIETIATGSNDEIKRVIKDILSEFYDSILPNKSKSMKNIARCYVEITSSSKSTIQAIMSLISKSSSFVVLPRSDAIGRFASSKQTTYFKKF